MCCVALGKAHEILIGEDATADCTVPEGAKLVNLPGPECSDVEEPPFFSADEAAQAACATEFDRANISSLTVSIDGGPLVETRDPRFEIVSPQRTVQLPEGNLLGVPPGPASFVAHSWASVITGLAPGDHTIVITPQGTPGLAPPATITVHVTPRCR